MAEIVEASATAGPGVLLGGDPGSYSRNRPKKQFRNPRNVRLDGSEVRRFLEASGMGFDAAAIREAMFFAERLNSALEVWRHVQSKRREGRL